MLSVCLCVCVSPFSTSKCLNQSLWKFFYVHHGTWAHLNGVLHKPLPLVCASIYVYLPITAGQQLGKNVTTATNTHATIKKNVECIIFCAVCVVPQEIRWSVLPKTSCSVNLKHKNGIIPTQHSVKRAYRNRKTLIIIHSLKCNTQCPQHQPLIMKVPLHYQEHATQTSFIFIYLGLCNNTSNRIDYIIIKLQDG
jgi:hypothetical protein